MGLGGQDRGLDQQSRTGQLVSADLRIKYYTEVSINPDLVWNYKTILQMLKQLKSAHHSVHSSVVCLSDVRVTYLYASELVQRDQWGHCGTGMAR